MSLPENRKFTWKICVHTTAWETRSLFFWDFERRQGSVCLSLFSCVLGVPAEPQNWARGCPPHSSHLEQEDRRSAPSVQEQHSIPQPSHGEGCSPCLTAAGSTQPHRRGNTPAIIAKRGLLLLSTAGACTRHLGDTQSTRKLQTIYRASLGGTAFPDGNSSPITYLLKPRLYGENFVSSCSFLGDQTSQD